MKENTDLKKFRQFNTSSGKLVLGGKSAENNEELIAQAKPNEILLHTKMPGSPFCNIKSEKEKVTKEDIYETGVFCAKFSQDWKHNHKDVEMHVFLSQDTRKEKGMKTGTFGVKKHKSIIIKTKDIEEFESK